MGQQCFEILNNTNLIDLHENVGDLEIKNKSKDILNENQSIRIFAIRLKNNGMIINNIEVISASNNYFCGLYEVTIVKNTNYA